MFIPLTQLCRDCCHYCTFAHPPRRHAAAYLTPDEVLAIARAGAAADCKEALFTLGDKPELRYRAARAELARLGHDSTIAYLAAMAALVLRETGLLPHVNPGVMSADEIARLRRCRSRRDLMLETTAERLGRRGGPHFGSPDKVPAARLATIGAAGAAAVPFTSGILIGIGETRRERIEALLALRDLHRRHGHLQEIIVQNFRAKPGTRMAAHAEPPLAEHLWTIAVARILFGPAMNIQAPPNLQPGALRASVAAGINDWGGVSPVTPDHVNPERPWPALDALARATADAGKVAGRAARGLSRFRRARGSLDRADAARARAADGRRRRLRPHGGLDARRGHRPACDAHDRTGTGIVDSHSAARGEGRGVERSRHRRPVRRTRAELSRSLRRGRRAARGQLRPRRELRRHPQHQLHQCLPLSLLVLRLLQGQDPRDICAGVRTT